MVVHNDEEGPTEVTTTIKSKMDKKSVFCVSETNEVTERNIKMKERSKLRQVPDVSRKRKVMKLKKKSKRRPQSTSASMSSSDCEDSNSISMEISDNDVLQLKTVYKKCKSVLKKMEQKYGELLDTDSSDNLEEPSLKRNKLQENECHCKFTKIMFDEDGNEVSIDSKPSTHICPTKLLSKNIHIPIVDQKETKHVEIEYHNKNSDLSDDLQILRSILKDPDIDTTYRNRVIEKMKVIQLEHWNELRFNKHSLIEKIKVDADEVLYFKGSNLSDITGYYTKK